MDQNIPLPWAVTAVVVVVVLVGVLIWRAQTPRTPDYNGPNIDTRMQYAGQSQQPR